MNNVRNAAKPIPAKIPKDNQFDCTMLAMPHATIKNRNRVKAYPETVCASFASRQIIARINSTAGIGLPAECRRHPLLSQRPLPSYEKGREQNTFALRTPNHEVCMPKNEMGIQQTG
ncbi:hypothetical protein I6E91_22860 [Enterocloster clostridioformis]|nr:hypothetical protein [Enterocloster clostridioformis]